MFCLAACDVKCNACVHRLVIVVHALVCTVMAVRVALVPHQAACSFSPVRRNQTRTAASSRLS